MRRPPETVAADVREGVVTPDAARSVYGVCLDGAGRVDSASTRALRGSRAPVPGQGKRMTLLPGICGSCGYAQRNAESGHGDRPFTIAERLMSDLGPVYTTGRETMLRELICPNCGAQVDAQVSRRGDARLTDTLEVT
jgi:hypothetical protein